MKYQHNKLKEEENNIYGIIKQKVITVKANDNDYI